MVREPTYNSTNLQFVELNSPSLEVTVSVRDMKYLSNSNDTIAITTDEAVMNGTKPMTIALNFNDIMS